MTGLLINKVEPALSHQPYIRGVTAKGQVTLPIAIRQALRVERNTQVSIQMIGGQVIIEPFAFTLEQAYGSVKPMTKPEDFKALRQARHDKLAEKLIKELAR